LNGFCEIRRNRSCSSDGFAAEGFDEKIRSSEISEAGKSEAGMRRYKKCHIVDIVLDSEHQVRLAQGFNVKSEEFLSCSLINEAQATAE
jgi:hypothetical protein